MKFEYGCTCQEHGQIVENNKENYNLLKEIKNLENMIIRINESLNERIDKIEDMSTHPEIRKQEKIRIACQPCSALGKTCKRNSHGEYRIGICQKCNGTGYIWD